MTIADNYMDEEFKTTAPIEQNVGKLVDQNAVQIPVLWTNTLKERFIGYVVKWRGLLLMNGYHINVEFSETAHPDKDDGETTSAEILTNHPYLSGHKITIYPRILKESDEDEQERKIVHELAHIITQGQKLLVRRTIEDKFVTWEEVKNENERATDWIANIVFALHSPDTSTVGNLAGKSG